MAQDMVIGLAEDFIQPVNVSSNTEGSLTPATNANEPSHPKRVFRGTGAAGSEWWMVDLTGGGTAATLSGILIDNSNILSLQVDGSNLASPVWPTGGEVAVELVHDPLQPGRPKGFVDLRGTSYETSVRWIRIEPTDGDTIDGTSTWALGGVTFLDAVHSFEVSSVLYNPSDIEFTPLRAAARIPRSNGGRYVGTRGLPRMSVAIAASAIAPEGLDPWKRLLGNAGQELVFWRNLDGAVGDCLRGDLAVVGGMSERYAFKQFGVTRIEEQA